MRSTAVEVHIDFDSFSEEQKANFLNLKKQKKIDFEYYAEKEMWTLWIHQDGHFQITHELLNSLITLLDKLLGVYNRQTGGEELNLYIETTDEEAGEFDIVRQDEQENETVYKNLTPVELIGVDLSNVKLKRELNASFSL